MRKQILLSAVLLIATLTFASVSGYSQDVSPQSNGTLEMLQVHLPDSVVFKPVEGVEFKTSELYMSILSGEEEFSPQYFGLSGIIGLSFDGGSRCTHQTTISVENLDFPAGFKPEKINFVLNGKEMVYDLATSRWEPEPEGTETEQVE